MRAMILAAGEGTRLRPLTLTRTKPMVPVVNRPNIAHVLDKVEAAGISEAAINLCYRANQIKSYVGQGSKWNLSVRYSLEKKLRGTAGSLAPLKKYFQKEPFIVLSGDGVSSLNIADLLRQHREVGAVATIVLVKTDARFEYGLVQLDEDRRVKALIEKPLWSEAFSAYVNTGIYMFDPEVLRWIPEDRNFDFAKDVFPLLFAKGVKVSGYFLDGYWCDIGNMKEYRRCHRDILEGRAGVQAPGELRGRDVWIGKNVHIAPNVKIEGPSAIGNGVTIEKGARIAPFSVIGEGSHIGSDAIVEESILWQNVTVARGVRISGCVLADGAHLKENLSFYDGAILSF